MRIPKKQMAKLFGVIAVCGMISRAALAQEGTDATACSTRNASIREEAAPLHLSATTEDLKKQARRQLATRMSSAEYVVACGTPATGVGKLTAAEFQKAAASLIEEGQVDKQVGANGGTGGSTTLVGHGLAPSILGFAFEAGGIERNVSGSVVTLRANPVTLLQALAKKYGPGIKPPDEAFLNALGRLNVAATFDTGRTPSTSAGSANPFLANYQQLTEFSARFALFNGRDPYRLKNWTKFNALAKTPAAANVVEAANAFLPTLMVDPAFSAALASAASSLVDATNDEERDAALKLFDTSLLSTIKRLSISGTVLESFVTNSQKVAEARNKLVKEIESQALVNLEYALVRPPSLTTASGGDVNTAFLQPYAMSLAAASPVVSSGLNATPDISALRLIATWRAGGSDLSWNAAATIFNTLRPGMSGQFRDFNTGAAASIPIGSLPRAGKVTATLAGRYMYLHQKPLGIDVLFNSAKVNTPGHIRWFQAKLTFPGPAKAIKIPLSFTYSNRTELIAEKDVRVNIGFSFDLDAVMRLWP
jgi:hypothetical protein